MATASPGEAPTETRVLRIASWEKRFWAWLVDVLLVGAVLSGLGEAVGVFTLVTGSVSATSPFVGLNGLALWVYWTVLEGRSGQSAGKMVMDLRVTDERGDDVDYVAAAVESFGKAFVLPLDVLIGWVAMEDEHVRLFNRLSSTVVIEVPEEDGVPEGVEYVMPEE